MRLAESAILVRIQPLFGLSAPVASPLESEKPTASPQRSPETRSLDLEIHRRCFSAVLFDLILDLLPLIERAQSSALDSRDVDKHIPCVYRKSDSTVMVMKSAEDGRRYDAAHVLDGAMDRSVFVERQMSPQLIIVGSILRQNPA